MTGASRKANGTPAPCDHDSRPGPGPDWLPLHRGRFFYAHRYRPPGVAFRDMIDWKVKRLEPGTELDIQLRTYGDGQIVEIKGELLELIIDGEDGIFFLSAIDSDEDICIDIRHSTIGLPEKMTSSLYYANPKEKFASEFNTLKFVAINIWEYLRYGFQKAVENGSAEIWGRPGSIIAPLVRIYPDQWHHLEVDWEALDRDEMIAPTAHGPEGEKVYSLYVAPSQLVADPKLDAERLCFDWLVQLRQLHESPPQTRDELVAEARQRWPQLPGRGFDRAWERAKSKAPRMGWSKPGRR